METADAIYHQPKALIFEDLGMRLQNQLFFLRISYTTSITNCIEL